MYASIEINFLWDTKKIQGICASSVHNSCFCLPHFWDPENVWYRKAYIDLDILRMDMYLARVCRLCVEMSISYAFVLHWLHLWFPPFLASWIREIWFVNVSFFPIFSRNINNKLCCRHVVYLFTCYWYWHILFELPQSYSDGKRTLCSQFPNRYGTHTSHV